MLHSQQFVESLIELLKHYQALQEEDQRSSAHATEQLAHVNALLVEQLMLQHNQQSVSIQALAIDRNSELTETANIGIEKFSTQEDSADMAEEAGSASGVDSVKKEDEVDELNNAFKSSQAASVSEPDQINNSDSITPSAALLRFEQSLIPSRSDSINGQSRSLLKTPMLPEYQQMTKLQAISSLLGENAGGILHIDYIIAALHGQLEPDTLRAEKGRMNQTLSEGTKKGLWQKVPQQPGCYTIELKLVEPELGSTETVQQCKVGFRQKQQSKGRASNIMLPRYHQLNFTEALEAVVQENAGQILNTEIVARALYGNLSGQALTKAKDKIGKALWSGAAQKRWQRVPGQIGYYTLDLRLIDPDLASASS